MSIHLKISNSLDSLAVYLSERIRQTGAVFRPVYVVTQTEGMNSWLKVQLAEYLGVAANIRFLRPNDFIQEVFQQLGEDKREAITKQDFSWLLFEALGNQDFIRCYPAIAEYYDSKLPDAAVKRMALAQKLADFFDQYQIYRPKMIQRWNEEVEEEEWQAFLWRKAKKHLGEQYSDKDGMEKGIVDALKVSKKKTLLQEEVPEVYFFGLSLITQYHYGLIQAIASAIEVEFLMQNPAPLDYWYEDKSPKLVDFLKRKGIYQEQEEAVANPLLVGWGKIIQDTFNLLFENEQALNNLEEVGLLPPEKDTLLHHLQHTIFHNQKDQFSFSQDQLADGSICVQSCYSPIREVEALYNYLVRLVDYKEPDLSVRDVVVMVTDIDLYASYIKAVFDEAPYRFRYTIADESYAVSDTHYNALGDLLLLTEEEFTSEKVVRLLDYSVIRKKFQIDDVGQIRQWVDAANIRFGFEGQLNNDTEYVSWKYGIKRLMYGLCMSGGEEYGTGTESFYPLDIVEGFDRIKVVQFVYFVDKLIESIKERSGKRSLSQWVEYVEQIIRVFIEEDREEERGEKNPLIKRLERYNILHEILREEVDYEVFLYHFLPSIEQSRRSEYFGLGGITFCSLVPMRSIPFKVVALLGMDFDKFPRKDEKVSFDLIQKEHQRGDRSLKDNDKHLFLETLLSAREYLYLSYNGRNIKDNTELLPSAMIDELLGFIENHSDTGFNVRKQLITHHPLHSFSSLYNSGKEGLYSYLLNSTKALHQVTTEKIEPDFDGAEISIDELIRFLEHPFRGYFNHVLKIYYNEDDLSLKETEVFTLNKLDKWIVNNDLLKLPKEEVIDYKCREVKLGRLPLKNMATIVVEEAQQHIAPVQEYYKNLTDGFEEDIKKVDLEVDQSRLTGAVEGCFGGQLIRYSFSKRENRYLLRAYLEYLLLAAQGNPATVKFISLKDGRVKTGGVVDKEEALKRLAEIVRWFKKGHFELLPFHCNFKIKAEDVTELGYNKFTSILHKYFNGYSHPCTDPYQVIPYRNGFFTERQFERYLEIAELLLVDVADFFKEIE